MSQREPNTLRGVIARMAETRPGAVFLFSPETKGERTFAELRRSSERLAQRLMGMGLSKGDKVAFLMDNGLFTAELFLGAMYAGFTVVPLNVRAGGPHIAYPLNHSDARAVFVSDEYRSLMDEIRGQLGPQVEVIRADVDRGPDWEVAEAPERPLPEVRPDDDALLVYTSGSTGRPKGAIFSHNKVLAGAWNSILAHDLSERDRSLCVLPLYHINAENVTLIPTLMTGGSVVMPRRFLVRSFWQWLTDYRCTWSALVPTIITQLLDWIDPCAEGMGEALKQIRFMRSSSAPLAPSLHRAFEEKFKLLLIEAMGSTECCGNIFSNPLPPGKDKIGTPGLPFGFEAKVVGPEGAEVARGEPGEIVLRGPSVMNGYYKGPQETAAALGPDGWLRTGDLACIDEDGYFFVVGRAKELIIKGGMNIAPRQIDEALEAHPGVLEAAAVGVPDHYFGEDVVAFAVARPGARVTEQDLLNCCESKLGRFKTPSRIHIVSELPKGPSGKIQRLRLTECFKELLPAAPGNGVAANGQPGRGPAAFESPRTPVEEMIAETWAAVLDVDKVGVQDNFFGLGGHSLLAIDALARLRARFMVELSVNEFFSNATVAQQAALVSERLARDSAPAAGRAALEEALRARRKAGACEGSIPPRDRSRPCPLSPAQERLWFLEKLNPGFEAYNEAEAARLRGPLNVRFLEDALNTVVSRHEALQTVIEVSGGRPVQVVRPSWRLRVELTDLTRLAPEGRESEVKRLLREEPRRPFDLAAAPAIRAALLRCGPEDHVLILTMHHMVCDGWSLPILYRELSAAYRASCRGEPLDLGPVPLHYPDFAAWRARQVEEEGSFAKELAFWKDYLRGAPAALELPAKGPRPEMFTYAGEKRVYPLGGDVAEGLHRLSRREEVSLFTVLAAAFNVLLSRYSGHDDVVLGIPIANRDRPELLTLFGFLIDFQALRTDLSGNPTFRELLGRVRRGILDVNAHRAVPFNRVVEALNPPRDLSRAPVFQTMLVWKDRHVQMQYLELEGLSTSHVVAHPGISKFDLTLWLTDVEDDVWLEVEYCTDLFSTEMIGQLIDAYRVVLRAVVADPEQRLAGLPVLPEEQRRRLLVQWNDTRADYPRDVCVHELIEAQAARTPAAAAVVMGDQRLTYAELDARADRMARRLRGLGVRPGARVGVCLGRSPDMVAALLAVLKAGAAYVPLDPDFPPARLADMLSDSAPAALLMQPALLDRLPPHGARVVLVEAAAVDDGEAGSAGRKARPEDPAYVLYTSGSTGRTKGVVVPHRAVVNLLTSMSREPGVSAGDVLLAVTTLSFDIAALELFLPLTVGGRVVLAGREVAADGPRLAELIDRSRATVMQATPATWRMLIDAGWRGDARLKILCGGEALPPALAEALLARCGSLWNVYGPTETTIWSTCERVGAVDRGRVTIGRPIANTRTYVLDAQGRLVPPGVAGELYIGGAGVACGYLNRPELTAERFTADGFADEPRARMYRTGDRARHLPDGRIEFLGRLDNQVKVRGFRIELGEIEAALERCPAVRQAVAVVHAGADGDGRLAAYVVARGAAPSSASLREHLRALLPDYMVPTTFVSMDALPLTPNGKVDRRALPVPEATRPDPDRDCAAPRTPTEKSLAEIWGAVLGIGRVGVHDNFFDLGGHSLLAVRLFTQIEKTFGKRLPLAMLFKGATVEHLARELQKPVDSGCRTEIIGIQPQGSQPPLFFLPSLVGEVMYCNRMARCLGPDQPVFGIQMHCGDGTTDPLSSLEAIAARCVEDLCAFQPEGPYRLAGYSFAGMLAFEMARQLSAEGREVDLAAVIDTGAIRVGAGASGHVLQNALGFLRNLPYWVLDDFLQTRPRDMVARVRRQIRAMRSGRGAVHPSSTSSRGLELEDLFDVGRASDGYRRMMQANLRAFQEYTPKPYPGRITLLRARARPLFHSHEADLGWGKFALGGVEIKTVPGNHDSILREPLVQTLAAQLKSALDRNEPRIASRRKKEVIAV